MLHQHTTLNIKGQLIDLESPKVMGIINATPDSFYADSRKTNQDEVLQLAHQMIADGATFIDIGGASSRPGAEEVSEQEELDRVIPLIEALKANITSFISIDTYNAKVAKLAVEAGAGLINDISGGDLDAKMFETVAELQVPYIAMHMTGTPKTMQKQIPDGDITLQVLDALIEKVGRLRALYVKDIIVDPGFGFGKSLDQNYELLNRLHTLQILETPILAGISRKSMIYKLLGITATEALNGTSVLHLKALQEGASILRVHDVKEAVETVTLFKKLNQHA